MSTTALLSYIAVMAIVTYLIRMIPLSLFQKKITNRFVRSFLYYVPYAVLSAMTFPAIFFSVGDSSTAVISAVVGTVAASILSLLEQKLIVVALCSCAAVFITNLIQNIL